VPGRWLLLARGIWFLALFMLIFSLFPTGQFVPSFTR